MRRSIRATESFDFRLAIAEPWSLAGRAGVVIARFAEIDKDPPVGVGLFAPFRNYVRQGGAVGCGLRARSRLRGGGTAEHLPPAPARIDPYAVRRERGTRGLLGSAERQHAADRQDDGRRAGCEKRAHGPFLPGLLVVDEL